MPPNKIAKIDGSYSDSQSLQELATEREILDKEMMSEILYQGFEKGIEELEERGIVLPPPTDENGNIMPGYQGQMQRTASMVAGEFRSGGVMPVSKNEQAIVSLMDIREDMLRQYASVSRDPMQAVTAAMSIQKLEAQIITMGGDIERFNPEKYQSGLKPVQQVVNPLESANKIVENTKQAYNLQEIKHIWAGTSPSGRVGVGIKIASNTPGQVIQGIVYPKRSFSGGEVIDYVPSSSGKGIMTVKAVNNGFWQDVSGDFDISWKIIEEKEDPTQQ